MTGGADVKKAKALRVGEKVELGCGTSVVVEGIFWFTELVGFDLAGDATSISRRDDGTFNILVSPDATEGLRELTRRIDATFGEG